MDGTIAQLDKICELAKKYDALVMSDECHSTGFIGPKGKGVPEELGVMDQVDIITGTLGKALGGASGGFTSGPKEIIELLRQKARPYLFSNALMPAIVAGTLQALDLVKKADKEREHLSDMSLFWKNGLVDLGFDIKEGNTPIVPIMLHESQLAQEFAKKLFQYGIYAVGFFFPVVPQGEARIRTQISSSHTEEQLAEALKVFKKVKSELSV